jgi:hypothetical protein
VDRLELRKVAYLSVWKVTKQPALAGAVKGTPMLKVVENTSEGEPVDAPSTLDELAREGARRMLAAALEAEVATYIEAHREARDERGRVVFPWNQDKSAFRNRVI